MKNRPHLKAKLTPAKAHGKSAVKMEEDPFAQQIQKYEEQISERIERVQLKHQKVNESLRAIRSQGVRLLGPDSKISQNSKAKLIALYQTAQRQCVSEHTTVEHLLDNIQKMRQARLRQRMSDKLTRGSLMVLLAQYAATLPLYIGSTDGHPPPLVGAIPQLPGISIPIGHFVAAFVEDVWILGEIKEQILTTKYLVRDIDDDDAGGGGKEMIIPASRVIPLPNFRADPRRHGHALFPKGAIVLALYPQTTCFYKGVVEAPPAGPNDDYLVAFEDSTFSIGYSPTLPVPQLYVLTHKEIHGRSRKKNVSSDLSEESEE